MIEKLKSVYARHREQINYLIFGVLTTLVNYVAYYPLVWFVDDGTVVFGGVRWYLVANVIAWIAAVIFSYIVNRRYVFGSQKKGAGAIAAEFFSFVGSRLLSLVVEEALMWIFVDVAGINEQITKIAVSVITVLLNYITGKLVVFRKQKQKSPSGTDEA